MDIWVASTFQILWIVLLWTWTYKCLFKTVLSILWGIYPEVELLDHVVIYLFIFEDLFLFGTSQVAPVVKNPPASAGDARDMSLIPRSGKSPGGGNGTPLLYSCLENSMDRGTWQAIAHGVAKSQTRLSTHSIQCLVTLSIFSCVCWYLHNFFLFFRNIYLNPLPIFFFMLLGDFCYCWIVGVLYIFWIFPTYQIHGLHVFSLIQWVDFLLWLSSFLRFIYFYFSMHWVFAAALGLSLVVESGDSVVAVHRLLLAVASLVAEHRL